MLPSRQRLFLGKVLHISARQYWTTKCIHHDSRASWEKSPGTEVVCLQSRTFINRKHLALLCRFLLQFCKCFKNVKVLSGLSVGVTRCSRVSAAGAQLIIKMEKFATRPWKLYVMPASVTASFTYIWPVCRLFVLSNLNHLLSPLKSLQIKVTARVGKKEDTLIPFFNSHWNICLNLWYFVYLSISFSLCPGWWRPGRKGIHCV